MSEQGQKGRVEPEGEPTIQPAPRRVVRVSRAQMFAARGRIITDHKLGLTTPGWVFKIAAADGDPRWAPGGHELARIARLPRARRSDELAASWWRRLPVVRRLAR